jgi:hypothetical protein
MGAIPPARAHLRNIRASPGSVRLGNMGVLLPVPHGVMGGPQKIRITGNLYTHQVQQTPAKAARVMDAVLGR